VIDYIVPANDDAVRAIKLMVATLADAVIEGQMMRKGDAEDGADVTMENANFDAYDKDEEEVSDEAYLGASTLAKLRDANLFTDEEEK